LSPRGEKLRRRPRAALEPAIFEAAPHQPNAIVAEKTITQPKKTYTIEVITIQRHVTVSYRCKLNIRFFVRLLK
jgi:hypothetical protein